MIEPRSGTRSIVLLAIAFAATVVVAVVLLPRAPWKATAPGDRPRERIPVAEDETLPKTFPILLDSTPDGADVYEGDVRVGTTPLRLVLDNDALNASPRRFRIQHSGYRPFFVTQGPSVDPVRIVAQLVPQ